MGMGMEEDGRPTWCERRTVYLVPRTTGVRSLSMLILRIQGAKIDSPTLSYRYKTAAKIDGKVMDAPDVESS